MSIEVKNIKGTILFTASFMAVIDRIIVNLAGLLNNIIDRFYISGMYEMIFEKRANSLNVFAMNLEAILTTLAVYTVAMIGGYLITTAYYRMNKALKIIVSIGVPLLFFILLPLLDTTIFNGKIFIAIEKIMKFVFGGETGNPYNLLLSCVLIVVVGVGLSWLLIRKAVEKN